MKQLSAWLAKEDIRIVKTDDGRPWAILFEWHIPDFWEKVKPAIKDGDSIECRMFPVFLAACIGDLVTTNRPHKRG